jgi:hypothetical protein
VRITLWRKIGFEWSHPVMKKGRRRRGNLFPFSQRRGSCILNGKAVRVRAAKRSLSPLQKKEGVEEGTCSPVSSDAGYVF